MKANDLYEQITARLIAEIEQGIANPDSWVKPWQVLTTGHRNATTTKPYRGFNQFWLWMVAHDMTYTAPVWATYKQWSGIGAQVRKGEKGTALMKWTERVKRQPGCKHDSGYSCGLCRQAFPSTFTVFNADQVDGYTYTPLAPRSEIERAETADAIIAAAEADGLTLVHMEQDAAYYSRTTDAITMPPATAFDSREGFYATAFHELAHSTGHPKRLDRDLHQRFGDDTYAMEELVAEFGAAFLSAATGIEAEPQGCHGHYLANWLKVLRDDSKALATAASKAQQAADYWLDRLPGTAEVAEDASEEVAA